MKKIITVTILFFISVGLIQLFGANVGSLSILCVTVFMAGLFIGQRQRKHG